MPRKGTGRATGRVVSAEPRLAYEDLPAAVDFLTRAFGLVERVDERLPADGGGFTATWFDLGDATLMVGQSGDHGLASPRETGSPTAMMLVTIDGLAEHYERAAEAGARIVTELHEVPWGFRRYEALDLEGHRWHFMEPR